LEKHQKTYEVDIKRIDTDVKSMSFWFAMFLLIYFIVTFAITLYGYTLHRTNASSIASLDERVSTLDQVFASRDDSKQMDAEILQLKMSLSKLQGTLSSYVKEEDLISNNEVQQSLKDELAQLQQTLHKLLPEVSAVKSKTDDVNKTTSQALLTASQALQAITGVCFPKSKQHGCPHGSSEVVLWHWYRPNDWDPFCGGAGHDVTEDAVDGSCHEDSSGNLETKMLGCCRSQ